MIGEDYKAGTEYAFRVPVRDSAGALQSGASPTVAIYKPDNSAESSPPSLTELGSTGVYRFAYTPASAGAYTFIVSASSCLTTVFTVQVRATERGDTYSRLGAPAGASIAADVAAVNAVADAIQAKTDNLPASPAAVGSQMDLVDAPNATALEAVADAVLDEEVNSASATGNSLRASAKAAWAQGFGRWVLSGTTLTLYGTDGTTAVRTFTIDDADNPTIRTPA